ncbi:hypothetical protein [Rhodanobacter denitrificans]|uniref:hypothetical protein n=1 Tax=Rhodanobacter denitrificans TaxID=666685 RepID=UPI001F3E4D3B|nr:hypothetical protein [Rhodanobacter denitrificans]UJJ60629.1 hypothetical protein LRK55_19535 [Rhodanobacter denitrificans]
MAQATFDVVAVVPRWQAEQARVDPEGLFAEHKFMQDEIEELREQLDRALSRRVPVGPAIRWETLGAYGEWVAITGREFDLLQAHGVGRQRCLYACDAMAATGPEPATALERALALADEVSPMPAQAYVALRTLRGRIRELEAAGAGASTEQRS